MPGRARGAIRPADDLVAPEVEQALDALKLDTPDAAAAQLARRYAAAIDATAVLAEQLHAAAYTAREDGDPKTAERVRALAAKVEAQAVLAELGPRLLAVLESLGATPRARAQNSKGPAAAPGGRLAGLRAKQAR